MVKLPKSYTVRRPMTSLSTWPPAEDRNEQDHCIRVSSLEHFDPLCDCSKTIERSSIHWTTTLRQFSSQYSAALKELRKVQIESWGTLIFFTLLYCTILLIFSTSWNCWPQNHQPLWYHNGPTLPWGHFFQFVQWRPKLRGGQEDLGGGSCVQKRVVSRDENAEYLNWIFLSRIFPFYYENYCPH